MLKSFLIFLTIKIILSQSTHTNVKLNETIKGIIVDAFSYQYYKLTIPEGIEKNKSNLIITIDQDEFKKEYSDPDIFVSKTIEKPSFIFSTWRSSKIGGDIISISSNEVFSNEIFYISILCIEKCEYELNAYLSETTKIDDDDIYFFNLNKNNPILLKLHTRKDFQEISISSMAFEFKQYKMYISKDSNPSSSNSLDVQQSWIYGYSYSMIKGDEDYCSDCDLYILLTTETNDVEINIYSEYPDSITQIISQNYFYDNVRENQCKCYYYDVKRYEKYTLIINIQLFSGTTLIQLNGFESKVNMSFYDIPYDDTTYEITYEKTIIIDENDINIFRNNAQQKGFVNLDRFHFCVLGYSTSSFSLQAATNFDITKTQYSNFILAGKSISGYLPSFSITSYILLDFSSNSNISITVNDLEGSIEIYGYFSENYEFFDTKKLNDIINGNKVIKPIYEWSGLNIYIDDEDNICHQKRKNDSKIDEKNIQPNCYLFIIINCKGKFNCLYKINTYQSKSTFLLIPRQSVYNTIPRDETDFYKIINDDENVEQIVIVLNSITGNADMEIYKYDEDINDYRFVDSSNNEKDLPDVLKIKTYNKKGIFSIQVNAKNFVTYSLYYYVIKSKKGFDIENIALNLQNGQIVYDYLESSSPFKIYSYSVDTENINDIRIGLTRRNNDLKFYVYKDLEQVRYIDYIFSNFDWESDYDTQIIIKSSDPGYIKKGFYYIIITRRYENEKFNFEDEDYYISITDEKNPLLLFENIQHSATLSINYQYQSYYYSTNSIEDLSISIYADYGKINVYIDFSYFTLFPTLSRTNLYYIEKDTSSIFLNIPKSDLEKKCQNENKCDIFIIVYYPGDEIIYGSTYMISGKIKYNAITTLIDGQDYKGAIDVKEEQYFVIYDLNDDNEKENYILNVKSDNGEVELYGFLIEIDNLNPIYFPKSNNYHYKAEEGQYDNLMLNIPKKDYEKCKNCKLLLTIKGIGLGFTGNSIYYTISFSSKITRITKESHIKDFIFEGENHYYKIYMDPKDKNVFISLYNVDGDTDIYVNYGLTAPTYKKYHWFSLEPTHQFINIDKNDPIITQLGKKDIGGDYTIMITGVTDSYYTLVVSGNRNLIDIGNNSPGSCKCKKSESCNFKFDLFENEKEYQIYDEIIHDDDIENLSFIITSNFLYGYGDMYAKLYEKQDYESIDDIIPNEDNYDFSNWEFNKRQFMKIDINKNDKRIEMESWFFISIKCNEDSLVEINTAKSYLTNYILDTRRENLYYFTKFTDNDVNLMPVLSHYLIYEKNLNFEIYSYKGKGKITVFQNKSTINESGDLIDLHNNIASLTINSKETQYGIVKYDKNKKFYNLFFRIEALEDFGFRIKLNYDHTWTRLSIGKQNSYIVNDNEFYGYFDLLDKYEDIVLSVMIKNPDEIANLYVKYDLYDLSVENLDDNKHKLDIPKEGNYDLKAETNRLLGSITLKIPQLPKEKRENKKCRVLFLVEFTKFSFDEDTIINILISPSVNNYKRIETQPKQIYFSSEKSTIKDTTIFDINKEKKKDNIIVLEISACRGTFETQLNNKVTYYKNPFTEIQSNPYLSKGRKVLTLLNATLDTYYLTVWVSGSNCDLTNTTQCNEEGGEYLLYYYSTDEENFRVSNFEPIFTYEEISSGKIKLKLPDFKIKTNEKININNFHIFISTDSKDFENMESLCFLSKMKINDINLKYDYDSNKNIFIIDGLTPSMTYYINIQYQNFKTGEKIVFKPLLIMLNKKEGNKLFTGFIIFVIVTLIVISLILYKKYKNTKDELEYHLTEIRSGFDISGDKPMIELGKISRKSKTKYTTLDEEKLD